MIEGPAFVTPHAIQQFQRRIRPLSVGEARAAILAGLRDPSAVRLTRNGQAVLVRARAPYRHAAIVRSGLGPLPTVVTVIPR